MQFIRGGEEKERTGVTGAHGDEACADEGFVGYVVTFALEVRYSKLIGDLRMGGGGRGLTMVAAMGTRIAKAESKLARLCNRWQKTHRTR